MPLAAGVPEILDRLPKIVGKIKFLPDFLIFVQLVFELEFEEFLGIFSFSHSFLPLLFF